MTILVLLTLNLFTFISYGQQVGCYINGECEDSTAIRITPNIASANDCWDACDQEPACLYFTFYYEDDVCIEYASCSSVNYDCQGCTTARVNSFSLLISFIITPE